MADEKKKKRNGGYYLKEKIAKLEAENEKLRMQRDDVVPKKVYETVEKERDELQKTIDQQSRKISQLTADLHSSETLRLNADNAHSKKEGAMLRAMGPIRRWWYEYDRPQFTDEDHWHD